MMRKVSSSVKRKSAAERILSRDPPELFPYPTLPLRSRTVARFSPSPKARTIKKEKEEEEENNNESRTSRTTSPAPKRSRTALVKQVARNAAVSSLSSETSRYRGRPFDEGKKSPAKIKKEKENEENPSHSRSSPPRVDQEKIQLLLPC